MNVSILKKATSYFGQSDLSFSPSDPIEKVVAVLGNNFSDLLNNTFSERLLNPNNSKLDSTQIQEVIEKYTNMNVAIAAATAAAPGPLGILSSAAELVLVTGNQLKMIYDLGCCHDKESLLNKDLLLDIPLQSMGISTDLSNFQNQLSQIKESPVELLQKKATSYAKVIALKNLKKSLVKFVPVAGSVMMSIWTKKGTKKIAGVATKFLDDAVVLPSISQQNSFKEEEPKEILVERIKILATLMEQNGSIKEEELAFLLPVIQNSPIEENEKKQLLTEAKRMGSHFDIDYNAIKSMPDAVDDLMTDMVILAKRDGEVGQNELAYLKETIRLLGETEEELLDLLHE